MTDSRRISRRKAVQIGALGTCGLTLSALWERRARCEELENSQRKRAKSCIVIFQQGGPSHHDTFDMKPEAPAEIRGEFQPVATSVAGYRICEHLPLTAAQAHRFCVVHAVHHDDPQHNNAGY